MNSKFSSVACLVILRASLIPRQMGNYFCSLRALYAVACIESYAPAKSELSFIVRSIPLVSGLSVILGAT